MPVANSEIIDIDKPFIGRQRNFVFYVECFIDCIPFDRYAAVLQSANHAAADIPRHPDSGRSFFLQQSLEGGAGRLVAIVIPVMLSTAGRQLQLEISADCITHDFYEIPSSLGCQVLVYFVAQRITSEKLPKRGKVIEHHDINDRKIRHEIVPELAIEHIVHTKKIQRNTSACEIVKTVQMSAAYKKNNSRGGGGGRRPGGAGGRGGRRGGGGGGRGN